MFSDVVDILKSDISDFDKVESIVDFFKRDFGLIEREYLLNAINMFLIEHNFSSSFITNLDYALNKRSVLKVC